MILLRARRIRVGGKKNKALETIFLSTQILPAERWSKSVFECCAGVVGTKQCSETLVRERNNNNNIIQYNIIRRVRIIINVYILHVVYIVYIIIICEHIPTPACGGSRSIDRGKTPPPGVCVSLESN